MKVKEIMSILEKESINARSAWNKGVAEYAQIILCNFDDEEELNGNIEETLLNGAPNWKEYSWGGCALIYDGDIAKIVCTKSELKRKKFGELPPNKNEQWLDVQARACYQACELIKRLVKEVA